MTTILLTGISSVLRLGAFNLLVLFLGVRPCIPSDYGWHTADAEAVGLNGAKLAAWRENLQAHHTNCLLVLRRNKIAYEWYAPGYRPAARHGTASLAKALVGGMSLLVAMNDGSIAPDDPACKYIPAWRGDLTKSKITIRHLASHTSGIENAEQDKLPHEKLPGWKGAFWRADSDPFSIAIHQAPLIFEPGTRYAYSNTGMAALAYAVTASLKDAPQTDILSLLRQRIMRPAGIPDQDWSIGRGRAFEVDGMKLYTNWGGAEYTVRAVARVGELMLHKAKWNGRQLLRREWVELALSYGDTPLDDSALVENELLAPGLAWWTNKNSVWADVPRDAFAGEGAGNQFLLVVPSLELVVVRMGRSLEDPPTAKGPHRVLHEYIVSPLMEALSFRMRQ